MMIATGGIVSLAEGIIDDTCLAQYLYFVIFLQYVEGCSRSRYSHHLTSELEGDRMVLKITKPPRNKDSLTGLTCQGLSWIVRVSYWIARFIMNFIFSLKFINLMSTKFTHQATDE